MPIEFRAFSPEDSPDTRKREIALFRENLGVILEHASRIRSCGELFHCTPSFAYVNTIFFGGGPIPLGILLMGWENGLLRETCPRCGRHALWILRLGGGLSLGYKWGICTACREEVFVDCGARGYIPVWRALLPLIASFPLYETLTLEVEKDVPEFSWSRGVVYRRKRVQETFPMKICEPLKLEALIRVLREGREGPCTEVVVLPPPEGPRLLALLRKLAFRRRGW